MTPLLALLLVHDLLLARDGIAAPANHPLRQAIERHKTRLKAEFVKARVRRGCASVEALRAAVAREKKAQQGARALYPRWVRVNNLRTTLGEQLRNTFAGYRRVQSLAELDTDDDDDEREKRVLYLDETMPDLLAVPPGVDLTTSQAYKNGEIILQDKASCLPAYLLLGEQQWSGDLIDGCAAPGNKTTHLASLLHQQKSTDRSDRREVKIFSMDASPERSKTLKKMVAQAGADVVTVLAGQDFLALDPADPRFANVTGLLLDPSCSGSGIIGRDDVPVLALPVKPGAAKSAAGQPRGKKRKRRDDDPLPGSKSGPSGQDEEAEETKDEKVDIARLTKLSNLQTRIVEHALRFPAATRVTYSTCSVHVLENESVTARVLASDVARQRGWRVLRREEQPAGLREWRYRGVRSDADRGRAPASLNGNGNGNAQNGTAAAVDLSDEELDACLRCWPGDEQGTGGFFVVGFMRDPAAAAGDDKNDNEAKDEAHEEEEEWEGFSD